MGHIVTGDGSIFGPAGDWHPKIKISQIKNPTFLEFLGTIYIEIHFLFQQFLYINHKFLSRFCWLDLFWEIPNVLSETRYSRSLLFQCVPARRRAPLVSERHKISVGRNAVDVKIRCT